MTAAFLLDSIIDMAGRAAGGVLARQIVWGVQMSGKKTIVMGGERNKKGKM